MKKKFKKVATPKWLQRPMNTTYLELFLKYIKETN